MVTVVPASQVSWDDLQLVFGRRGPAARCQCQRYKLSPGESFGSTPVEERAHRLRVQTDCGQDGGQGGGEGGAGSTSGLVAHLDGEPAGWCAVEPRPAYVGLVRTGRVPWADRSEDRSDVRVWAVTCLLTRAGLRRRGVSRALLRAAVEHAREHGARAIEGYPITTTAVISEELHVGVDTVFVAAGFAEVSRPSPRRVVMRIDF